jgi:hypothetical protein
MSKNKIRDDRGNIIYIGDTLKSEWGYSVIVVKDTDGSFSGKLICEDNHSCKNIPYSLNRGKGYIKILN